MTDSITQEDQALIDLALASFALDFRYLVDVEVQANKIEARVTYSKPKAESKPKVIRLCSFEGCGRVHVGRGLCDAHRRQLRRGKPLTPIRSTRKTADTNS